MSDIREDDDIVDIQNITFPRRWLDLGLLRDLRAGRHAQVVVAVQLRDAIHASACPAPAARRFLTQTGAYWASSGNYGKL